MKGNTKSIYENPQEQTIVKSKILDRISQELSERRELVTYYTKSDDGHRTYTKENIVEPEEN